MLKHLANLLFPKTCNGCDGLLLDSEPVICTACRHELPYTLHHLNPDNEAAKKFKGKVPVEHTSALLYFHKEGIVQELIHNLKYRGQQDVGQLMGQWYAPQLQTVAALHDVTDVIPVPLHKKKLRLRGYNQVAQFGMALAEGLSKSYTDDVLLRGQFTKTQTKKNLADRAAIIGSAFGVNYNETHHNRHFLLVDDVITTGATLEACARLLLDIPGCRVSIAAIAFAHS